jgi:hypothetical protein
MESGRTREAVKAMSYHNSILVKYIDDEIRKLDELNGLSNAEGEKG